MTTNNNISAHPIIIAILDQNKQDILNSFPYWQPLEEYRKNPDPNIVKFSRGSELLRLLEEIGALTFNAQGSLALKDFFTSEVQPTKNKVSRLLGFMAEALIVSSCRENIDANRKWAKYARRGTRITDTPDNYIAIGTGLNSTKKEILFNKLYNRFEPERDIMWVHKDNVEKELPVLKKGSYNHNKLIGLQVKVGSVDYVVYSLRRSNYQVPVVFFDLNGDFAAARNRLINPRTEDLFPAWDAYKIDEIFIRGKDVDEDLHEALKEHSVLLKEVVEGRMKLENLVERIPEVTTALSILCAEEILPKSTQILAVNYEDLSKPVEEKPARDYLAEILNRKQAISLGLAKEVSNLQCQAISLYETLSTEAEKYTEDSKFEPVSFSFYEGELSVFYRSGDFQIRTNFTLDKNQETWEATVNLWDLRQLSRLPKSEDIKITFDRDSSTIVFSSGGTKINIPTVESGSQVEPFYFDPDFQISWDKEANLFGNELNVTFFSTLIACAQLAIQTGNPSLELSKNKFFSFRVCDNDYFSVSGEGGCLYDSEERIRIACYIWLSEHLSVGSRTDFYSPYFMIPTAAIAALPISEFPIIYLLQARSIGNHIFGEFLIENTKFAIRGKLGENFHYRFRPNFIHNSTRSYTYDSNILLNSLALKKALSQINKIENCELTIEIIEQDSIQLLTNNKTIKISNISVFPIPNAKLILTVDIKLIKIIWQQLLNFNLNKLDKLNDNIHMVIYKGVEGHEGYFLEFSRWVNHSDLCYYIPTISKIECRNIDSPQPIIKLIKSFPGKSESEPTVVIEQVEIPYIETPAEPRTYKDQLSQIRVIVAEVKKALNTEKYHNLDADTVARIEYFRKQLESIWILAQEFINLANLHYENSGTKLSQENPLRDADGNPISKEQLRQVTIDIYQLLNRIRSVELNVIKLEPRIRLLSS